MGHLRKLVGYALLIAVAIGCWAVSQPKRETFPTTIATEAPPMTTLAPVPTATSMPTPTPMPQRAGCPEGCVTPPPGCVIKGNVGFDSGEKIYHVPGGEFYAATVIDPYYGERWFCTEAEAIANGWRKSAR